MFEAGKTLKARNKAHTLSPRSIGFHAFRLLVSPIPKYWRLTQ
jgi:hypothetical protein